MAGGGCGEMHTESGGCEALPKANRMQKRYVQVLYLSPGFGDFGIYHDDFARIGVWCESDGRKGFVGWIMRSSQPHSCSNRQQET